MMFTMYLNKKLKGGIIVNREEVGMIGFEIVSYAGEARSQLIEALNLAKVGKYKEAEELVDQAGETLNEAHKTQTQMLQQEASGDYADIGFIMIHGQDHLMTAMLLKDLVKYFIDLYKELHSKVDG